MGYPILRSETIARHLAGSPSCLASGTDVRELGRHRHRSFGCATAHSLRPRQRRDGGSARSESGQKKIRFLRGLGNGTFEAAVDYASIDDFTRVLFADLNQDGSPDIVHNSWAKVRQSPCAWRWPRVR